MTERLDDITKRHAAATKGPYHWDSDVTSIHDENLTTPSLVTNGGFGVLCCDGVENAPSDADSEFIAHSWQDIDYLLKRLTAANEEAQRTLAIHKGELREADLLTREAMKCANFLDRRLAAAEAVCEAAREHRKAVAGSKGPIKFAEKFAVMCERLNAWQAVVGAEKQQEGEPNASESNETETQH